MKKILLSCIFALIGYLLNAQALEVTGNGNLRSGPGTTNEIIGKVTTGTKVSQIDFSNDWYKVELPNKSSGWIYKTLVKVVKQGNAIVSQKPDTVQMAATQITNAIREVIATIFKTKNFRLDLSITPEHPLKISLSLDKNGMTSLGGTDEKFPITGMVNLQTSGMFSVDATPKPGYDPKMSGTQITSENFVSCINAGEFECGGYYLLKSTIPLYFESGAIVFTDNEKPCTFSEGSVLFYNSVKYINTGSKWVQN